MMHLLATVLKLPITSVSQKAEERIILHTTV